MMISCDNCNGACCRWLRLETGRMSEPDKRLLELRGGEVRGKYTYIPSTCRALQSGRCSIYENRPLPCKAMLVGGELCKQVRKLEGFVD